MLDDVFAEAIVHKPRGLIARLSGKTAHVVLGTRLRPFSFWHAFNLELVRYAVGNIPSFTELYLATRCCTARYPEVATHWLDTFAGRAHRSVITARYGPRFINDAVFRVNQVKKFLDYRKDYADCQPEIQETGESVKLPWQAYQVSLLRKWRPELTEGQAWDAPVAAAQWWLLCRMAAEGAKIDLITPEDRKDLAEMTNQTSNLKPQTSP